MKTRKGIAFILTAGTWANSPSLLSSLVTMIQPPNKRNHCSVRMPKSSSDGTAGTLIALVNPAHHSAIRAVIKNGSIPMDGVVATSLGPIKDGTKADRLFKLALTRYGRGTWKIEPATAEAPAAEASSAPTPSDPPATVEASTPPETPARTEQAEAGTAPAAEPDPVATEHGETAPTEADKAEVPTETAAAVA